MVIPQALAWRLFTKGLGRAEREAALVVEGDRTLAEPLLTSVAIVG